jgi:uncharacterized paraquat-inducible protein A
MKITRLITMQMHECKNCEFMEYKQNKTCTKCGMPITREKLQEHLLDLLSQATHVTELLTYHGS